MKTLMVRELALAVIVPAHDVKTTDGTSARNLLRSRRLEIIDVQWTRTMHTVLKRAHQHRRAIQAIDVRDAFLARAASTWVEGLSRRRYTLIALAVLQLQIWVAILTTRTEVLLLLLKIGVYASVGGTLRTFILIGILSLIDLLLGLCAGLHVIFPLTTLARLYVEQQLLLFEIGALIRAILQLYALDIHELFWG